MSAPKRIGIVARPGGADLASLLGSIVSVLRAHGVGIACEAEIGPPAESIAGVEVLPREQVLTRSELVIVFGGDGTVLGVARDMGEMSVPILGVNRGHLGFLADVSPEVVDSALEKVLAGDYEIRERVRLRVSRLSTGALRAGDLVLNDAVVTKATPLARMIELQTWVGGERLAMYRSDGLIVATPTGSTAYNLSAGGPLLDPSLRVMVLNPICPHTLTQRPLVLPDDAEVEVELVSREEVALTLDGQTVEMLRPGDRARITCSRHPARFVELPPYNHFETLRTKLGWGTR
jgi:NAD+ kinase